MHCHRGTNNRAQLWTFTDPCKPEVRPGAQEKSASLAGLAAPAMNARDTTKGIYGGLTLDMDRHYIRSITATTHQEKGIITIESNPSRGTVLHVPSQQGKGNKFDKNVKYKRTDALSLKLLPSKFKTSCLITAVKPIRFCIAFLFRSCAWL